MPQFDKQNSLYRLVVYMNPDGKQCQVFYSFAGDDKKDPGTSGNKMVRRLLLQQKFLKGKYTTALLYNNQTGVMLRKWVKGVEEDINRKPTVQAAEVVVPPPSASQPKRIVVAGFR